MSLAVLENRFFFYMASLISAFNALVSFGESPTFFKVLINVLKELTSLLATLASNKD
jgi:hypothetical protein